MGDVGSTESQGSGGPGFAGAGAGTEPLNVDDYERLAEASLEPGAHGYFAGGAGDERCLRENVEAWRGHRLRPRVLVDVSGATAATTVLGTDVSMPVLVAPTAFHRMLHEDGEAGTARAAAAAGTLMCLSTLATSSPAEVAVAAPGAPRWFQLYVFRDRGVTGALVEQAVEAGFEAIVLTVDAPRLGRRERDLRTGFHVPADVVVPSIANLEGEWAGATPLEVLSRIDDSLGWGDLERLVAASPVPVVVKGVQTGEDAALACEHGAAAVVVSNHGGRQLDAVAPTAELLPEVVAAVAGRIEVYVDGGIRRGSDVVVALALGARAVLVGRPVLWGLAHDGEAGARRVLELLRDEVELALALCGCASPAAVTRDHVGMLRR
jgi:isopentenyl diphosphate isomerase/L-lactate dehydrogenase-like FMN-dependent dehydrogenase